MHSTPSQRVKTTGYFAGSKIQRSVAPSLTWRFTLLRSRIAPVSHSPAGTTTRPPPALVQASIAAARAAETSTPGWAPKSVMGKSRAGNSGALIRASMAGNSSQPVTRRGTARAELPSSFCTSRPARMNGPVPLGSLSTMGSLM